MDVPAEFISDDEPQTVSSSHLKNKHRQAVPIRPAGVSQGEIGSPKELWEKSSYKVAESSRSRSVSSPQKAALKPGIAHMADSAKTAKMSHRPKALPKPRSAKPALRSGMSVFKPHTSTQQAPISRQEQPHVHPCWETWPPGSKVCQNVGMGPWKHQVLCGPASTFRLEPVNRKARRTPTNTWSVKSAAHLLEEAKQIAGIKCMEEEMAPLEEEPDQAPTGDTGKMADRSIGGAMDAEVLQVVPGDCYTMESEPPGREDTSSQQVALWAVGLQQQQPAPEHVALSGVTKIVETGTLGKLTICKEDDVITTSPPPHKVTYGDFLVVKGGTIATTQRQERLLKQRRSLQGLSYLATWKPKTETEENKSIHHLCTAPVSDILPLRLQLASRACHTLCQLPVEPQVTQERAALSQVPDQPQHGIGPPGLPAARLRGDGVPRPSALAAWQRVNELCVGRPRVTLDGRLSPLCASKLKMFWNPAPPKFSCTPSVMKDKLFPKYQPSWKNLSMEELSEVGQDLKKLTRDSMDREPAEVRRTFRKSQSMTDVSAKSLVEPAASQEQAVKHSLSAPHLSSGLAGAVEDLKAASDRQHPAMACVAQTLVQARREPVNMPLRGARQGHVRSKREGVSLRERTITAPSRRRLSKGGEKVAPIHESMGEDRRALPRGRSLDHVTSGPADTSLAGRVSLGPCSSLPLLLGLEQYTAQQGGVLVDPALQEWVQNFRVTWSDELVPPDGSSDGKESHSPASQCTQEALHRLRERELFLREIRALGTAELSLTSDTGVTDSDLDNEVARLTQSLAKQERANAFDLCRRGALYKKRGHLDLAMEDLDQAISLESHLLDAYWHRHSIHLLKRNLTQALADLNFIIKHNNKHADAFRSRAEIYCMKGDTAMAIANYSQAIKFRPQDDDMYFRRAEMYEKRSETLLAMEDYEKTFAINPRRSDALLIQGLQHFHTSSWEVAFADFSLLLQLEPRSARARQYRGRIYAKLGMFQEAVADLSLAVQLDPNNWTSFYLRGCLLRKKQPEAALRDLSVSVLINNSTENLRAFLHRGLLYVGLKQWKPAASDFKSVIKLDRSVVLAHMNLGLIYMLQMDRNYEAIRLFTHTLKARPTHIQGYICRAQAYHNVRDFRRAVSDLSRAIHMKPDDQLLYIMRGQYLCDMEQFDLASFYIHYAAQMDKVGVNPSDTALPSAWESSPVQQAAIQTFLGNDSKAMNQLQAATNTLPSLHGLLLLGKTQMKAQKFPEAVESFRKALTLLIPDQCGVWSLPEVAEVFYNIGLSYVAQDNLSQALDAFSGAVKFNPNLADAYHQRGLCRMRLRQPKSVQDFNRALAIEPSLFQVYLSRAAFYEDQGRFAKAILNCSKAIQIQPKSVRAYLHRGTLKFCRRMYSGAAEDFTSAIQTDNTCSFAYYNRGVCYHHMKQYKLALRDYGIVLLLANGKEIDLKVLINRALLHVELNDRHNALQDLKTASGQCPEDPAIFHALGVLHHRLGNLQDSVGAYTEAVRLKPLFPEAYIGRGNALMDYGHTEADKRAQRDFVAGLHLNPLSPAARVSLGYNLQDFGSFQSAWNQFTVAIDLEPGCWAAFEGRALVNLRMKNSYGAFHDINTALKHNPLSDLLHTNRGVIRQLLGDGASAMKDYQKAISLNPDCALAFFNAANLYFYNRQFEQACQFYTRALELDSSDDSALLNRAIAHAVLQRIPEALQDFSMALGINPLNSHIFFNRANVYCSLKRYHLAEKDLTQALQLLPNDALIYKLRADVRGHLGLTEPAISDYKMALRLQEAEENGCCISPGDTIKF